MPIQSRTSVVPRSLTEEPEGERGEAERCQPQRPDGAEACEAGLGQRRAFAHGGDRRHAGRADRRPQAGKERDEDPDEQRDDDRPRLQQEPLVREREADHVEELEEPFREREAGEETDDRCDRSDDERLEMIEPSTWRREPPSVRRVANSRVRWAIVIESEFAITKLPTKSAMPAKASRKPCRKVMNSFVSAASSSACSEASSHLAVGGRTCSISWTSFAVETPGSAATAISSSLPCLVEDLLSRGQVEARKRGAADRRDRAEPEDAGDAQTLDRPVALYADHLADREVLLVGRRLVDRHLAGPRPGALDEGQRVEDRIAVGDAEAEVGRAAVDDRLAVVPDQLGLAVDAALGCGDARHLAHLLEQRLVEGGAGRPAPLETSNADLPVITAVEPARDSVKIESNALSIESVRT